MKSDERQFLEQCFHRIVNHYNERPGVWPREIINEPGFPLHHKRAWYLLEKWDSKGWYEYGVTLDLGWFTAEVI